jgi:hypothetical protein
LGQYVSGNYVLSVLEIVYCLKSNKMSIKQLTGVGRVTVIIMEELEVTDASYVYKK